MSLKFPPFLFLTIFLLLISCFWETSKNVHSALTPKGISRPVFPKAEGFGSTTPAGRGGQIIKVTNLNDKGPGSLRAAIQAGGARIIVFEVSGTIVLSSNLVITNPYATIAGQTAPSPGITLRRGTLQINTHDVLVQHIRIRVGDDSGGPRLPERDGLDIDSNAYNVVVDHCSISWAIDEIVCIKHAKNVTISNSIMSECLNDSFNSKGPHSKAILVNYDAKKVSLIKNLIAHNDDRHPNFAGDSSGLSLNNLYYNFGYRAAAFSYNEKPYVTREPLLYSDVGCVYKAGTNTNLASRGVKAVYHIHSSVIPPAKIYLADYLLIPTSLPDIKGGASVLVNSPPIWDDSLTIMPSSVVEAYVLANAGARPVDRDVVDERIVKDVKAGTGSIIDTPNKVGGWPKLQNNYRVFTIPLNPNGDNNGDGYTNIETVLHQMASEVERGSKP